MKNCKTRKEPRNVLADSLSLPLGVISNRPPYCSISVFSVTKKFEL